jgi:ribosomal protein S18 acetylase RimI-like enzyme
MTLKVTRLARSRVPAAAAFLEARLETSLFLLASLDRYGPDATEIPTSGNYYEVSADHQVVAVFAVTRRGHLLAQTCGRRDVVPDILEACRRHEVKITGIVAEWTAAEALLEALGEGAGFAPAYVSRNVVCHREMRHDDSEHIDDVRRLRSSDFDQWFTLYDALMRDQGATPPRRQDLQTHFERRSAAGWWWGAFDRGTLTGIVAVDEVYRTGLQIGGLYVRPEDRRRGFATALMAGLQRDCLLDTHAVGRMVLFVRSDNLRAQRFYDGLGFQRAGHFALIW